MEIETESGVERDTGGEEMGLWEEDWSGQRFLAARGKRGVGSGEGSEWGSARVSSGADWAGLGPAREGGRPRRAVVQAWPGVQAASLPKYLSFPI